MAHEMGKMFLRLFRCSEASTFHLISRRYCPAASLSLLASAFRPLLLIRSQNKQGELHRNARVSHHKQHS
jgi:hypothetical protein